MQPRKNYCGSINFFQFVIDTSESLRTAGMSAPEISRVLQ